MEIVKRKLSDLKPYKRNPRINSKAVDAIAQSIQEYGFRQPIVTTADGEIIAGHTRYKAAEKLGLDIVPVHIAEGLNEAQIKAYRIADNKLAELSQWDKELLPLELADLRGMDVDLSLLGFNEAELEALVGAGIHGTIGEGDPDSVPAPPDNAETQAGDIWKLGSHRLMCGDSSLPHHVDQLLDGQTIQLVNTDPPYNVKIESRSNAAMAAGLSSFDDGKTSSNNKLRAKDRPIENDNVSEQEFDRLLRAWFHNIARVLEPGRAFYLWGGYANCASYPHALKESGLYFSQAIIWVKEYPVINRKDFMSDHEWCFYGWKEGAAHYFNPEINNARDVWSIKKVAPQSMVHLTEKPVELATRAITYSSRPGDNVLDLFGGSGSTLIAAEQTGRKAFVMEIDPLYCDVMIKRYEEFTGKKAELITRTEITGEGHG